MPDIPRSYGQNITQGFKVSGGILYAYDQDERISVYGRPYFNTTTKKLIAQQD